ncbi:unnamed protein product [Hermetia illucens]|uniref:Major facilitator superfamily (MFS) profile domain-containing protein n=1 Tax=Hermetia illucens TaxID=343691 RepID=A0A7R8U9H4_HERIL|nr:unnamed protein product [Hermetia illucens]
MQVFNWSESVKANVLGAFFWGYMLSQIPGGYLAEKYGAKYVLLLATVICSLLSLITPIGTHLGDWYLLFAIRIVIGLCQGVTFPACHVIISKWAPLDERGVLATIAYSGTSLGVVGMMSTSGQITESLGWPNIFHIWGGVGLCWCVIWFIFGGSTPAKCKFVSFAEKKYIEQSQGMSNSEKRPNTPWLKMMTSAPAIALFVTDSTTQWAMTMLFVQGPRYTRYVHDLSIRENAIASAIPHFTLFCLCFLCCVIADILERKKILSAVKNRKLFNTIGGLVPAVALIGMSFTNQDQKFAAIFLLTMAVGCSAGTYVGFLINHIDLTPNFAGTLMGVSNALSNVFAIASQAVVGGVVKDATNPKQWQLIFLTTSGILVLGSIVFLYFGKADVQPWNISEENERPSIVAPVPMGDSGIYEKESISENAV